MKLQSAGSGPPGYTKSARCNHPNSDHRKYKGANDTYFVWCTKCVANRTLCALSLKGVNVGDLQEAKYNN